MPFSTILSTIDWDALKIKELETWCFAQADSLSRARGLMLDDSRAMLAKAVAAAIQRASLMLERYARGEPSPEFDLGSWLRGRKRGAQDSLRRKAGEIRRADT